MSTPGRRANRDPQGQATALPLPYLLAMALAAALSAGAWVYLVRSAIAFGRLARGGQGQAWLFTGAASVGATVCALLVIVLLARMLRSLGIISDYKPRRAADRRRAR